MFAVFAVICGFVLALLFTQAQESYFWKKVELDVTRPLTVLTNNCQIEFDVDPLAAKPAVLIFNFLNADGSKGLNSFGYDSSQNVITAYANSGAEACLVRFLIPPNYESLNDITVSCKGNCDFRKTFSQRLKFGQLTLKGASLFVDVRNLETARLTIEAFYLIMAGKGNSVGSYCLYATTAIVQLSGIDPAEGFSYYLTDSIDIESTQGASQARGAILLSQVPPVCNFQNHEVKVSSYLIVQNKLQKNRPKHTFVSDSEIQQIAYAMPLPSQSRHFFFIVNLSINVVVQRAPPTPAELGAAGLARYVEEAVFVPDFGSQVQTVIQRFSELGLRSKIFVLQIRLIDFHNKNRETVLGLYLFERPSRVLTGIYVSRRMSLLRKIFEIETVDVSLFRNALEDDLDASGKLAVLELVRARIEAAFQKAVVSQPLLDKGLREHLFNGRLFFINLDAE